jgi:hypothetical protein
MPSTYEPIATQTLGSAAATVTFSSIPSTYTDLVVVLNLLPDSGTLAFIRTTLNNDSGSNYSFTFLLGTGSSAISGRATSTASLIGDYTFGASTTIPTTTIMNIQNYSNTTTNKTAITRMSDQNAGFVGSYASLWRNTGAVNRLDFNAVIGSYKAGSTFTLYGIKAA